MSLNVVLDEIVTFISIFSVRDQAEVNSASPIMPTATWLQDDTTNGAFSENTETIILKMWDVK